VKSPEQAITEWESAFRSGTRREAIIRNEKMERYFDYLSESYTVAEDITSSPTAAMAVSAFEALSLGPADTVLEIGCGAGEAAIALAERAASVTAVDMSGGMLRLAKEQAAGKGLTNITFEKAMWEAYIPQGRYSLAFSAMCPAICAIEELLRFEEAARHCALITTGAGTTTALRSEMRAYVTSNPLPGLMADGAYLFDMLYALGRHPNVLQKRVYSSLRMPAEKAIERYQMYYSCYGLDDSLSARRIADFIYENSPGGVWSEANNAVYMMAYWESPSR